MTVHDITHIDALWQMADMVVGEGYPLTPTEAFVLGGAFLIHDLGMALASYPNGLSEIEELSEWKDAVIQLSSHGVEDQGSNNDSKIITDNIKLMATELA